MRGISAIFLGIFIWSSGGVAEPIEVDQRIVFATDISGSIGIQSYRTQRDGLIAALRDEEVQWSLSNGPLGMVAVTYFEWAGVLDQQLRVPWMVLHRETVAQDIEVFIAALLEATKSVKLPIASSGDGEGPTMSGGGYTSIAGALKFTREKLLTNAPYVAQRTVVDVSGDGRESYGSPPDRERDLLIANGDVTINGIVILGIEPNVYEYYQEHVMAGPKSFVLPVTKISEYGEIMLKKLRSEVASLR